MREIALERFYQRILAEIRDVTSDESKTSRERYRDVYELVKMRDKEIARAFDAPRRSVAQLHLLMIRRLGLLTDEEISQFSESTRDAVFTLVRPRVFSGNELLPEGS